MSIVMATYFMLMLDFRFPTLSYLLDLRSPAADPLSALHLPTSWRCKRGEHRGKTHWICTGRIFKVQFFSNEVTIFALSFRFKAQQCNSLNLKVSYDLSHLTKN